MIGIDTHVVLIPSPAGPIPTPIPMPFAGPLSRNLSTTVFIDGDPAAVVGSVADNMPPHIPVGGPFQTPPSNEGTVKQGSATVFVDDVALARAGDPVDCCNYPVDLPTGQIIAFCTVISD